MTLIQTLRTPRFCGIAIFDLVMTLIISAWVFNYYGHGYMLGILWALPLGIFTHWFFAVDTTLNGWLGLNRRMS
jgi:hypothetical protein